MDMGGEDSDKIVRDSADDLTIKVSPDEEKYRLKYLPDPKKLTDEKLVCTVCSVSLANDIHKGNEVYIHRALKVLVCEACFNFYGDGCFSTDEDGDDKYCRWCGQGGTLFLCSACNCAFCQKCVKQNLKASVLAELENDDWKCYFCNPRPLFGCRTICWGAQELNKIGVEKEKEKIKKQKERFGKMDEKKEEIKKAKTKINQTCDDEQSTKKRKSKVESTDSSSSEVMPAKKTRASEGNGPVNGSINRPQRSGKNSSSDSEGNSPRKSRSSTKKTSKNESSSEYKSDSKIKKKSKLRKKARESSEDSSIEDKRKLRRKSKKKRPGSTYDEESSDEKSVKKKLTKRKKHVSESSSDNKPKKKKLKGRDSSSEENYSERNSKKKKQAKKKKDSETSNEDSNDDSKRGKSRQSESKKIDEESDGGGKKGKKSLVKSRDVTAKLNKLSEENALVKKRIKLAMLWLSSTLKDASDLGSLIALRATKFGNKKINSENLKTYDDVMNVVGKLKQLISGIHSNYEHIEEVLEGHVKPWKILTGIDKVEGNKNIAEETIVVKTDPVEENKLNSEPNNEPTDQTKPDRKKESDESGTVLQWSGLSADEDSSEESARTKALITKANEMLENESKEDEEKRSNDDLQTKDSTSDIAKQDDCVNLSLTFNESELSESLIENSQNNSRDNEEEMLATNCTKEDNNGTTNSLKCESGSDADVVSNTPAEDAEKDNKSNEDDDNVKEAKVEEKPDSPKESEAVSSEANEKKGRKGERKGIVNVNPPNSSSDDELNSLSIKLKAKWKSEESMNLKTSLGIDSSGESDVDFEPDNEKKRVTKTQHKVKKDKIQQEKNKRDSKVKDEDDTEVEKKRKLQRKNYKKITSGNTGQQSKQVRSKQNQSKNNTLTSDESDVEDFDQDEENKYARNCKNKDNEEEIEENDAGTDHDLIDNEDTNKELKDKGKKGVGNAHDKDEKQSKKQGRGIQFKNDSKVEKEKELPRKEKKKKTPEKKGESKSDSTKQNKKKTLTNYDSDIKDLDCGQDKQELIDDEVTNKEFKDKDNKEIEKDKEQSKKKRRCIKMEDDCNVEKELASKEKKNKTHKKKEQSVTDSTKQNKKNILISDDSDIEDLDCGQNKGEPTDDEVTNKETSKKGIEKLCGKYKEESKKKKQSIQIEDDSKVKKELPRKEQKYKTHEKEGDSITDSTKQNKKTSDDSDIEDLDCGQDKEEESRSNKKAKDKENNSSLMCVNNEEQLEAITDGNINDLTSDEEDQLLSKTQTLKRSVKDQGESCKIKAEHGESKNPKQSKKSAKNKSKDGKQSSNKRSGCTEQSESDNDSEIGESAEKRDNSNVFSPESNVNEELVENRKEEEITSGNATQQNSKKHCFIGLDSSDEEAVKTDANNEIMIEETKDKVKDKSQLKEGKCVYTLCLESSDDEELMPDQIVSAEMKEDSDCEEVTKEEDDDKSASLDGLSSAKSSDSEIITKRKRKTKSGSDSDASEVLGKKSQASKPKRKRVRMVADSSDESEGSDDEDNVKVRKRKSSTGESPGKGHYRKNIKKIKGKDDLAEATIEAAEEEKERRRRVEERQKLFNQMFEVKEAHVLEKLVLDFDPKEKMELLSVDKSLVSKMKPHQVKGVKFMWDSCFESLSEMKKTKGSGCILAHCMGLGKTFQVISLVHTLLANEELTGIHNVMVVCPLSTVLNWYNEFDKWLQGVEGGNDIEVFHLTKCKQNLERARELRRWQHNGGVLIMGYEMFRNLTAETNKKFRVKMKKDFQETLIDPGADLIVCDEGHMLKNEQTALSKAMNKVKTLRRIVLTGTPMQNNLNEYHCMVQFVKPNLLGTRKEFLNRFVNPISNGQFVDSTDADVKVMKRRAHVLHKMLEGLVQRFDYNVLTPFLPPKHEYVVSICLSELQIKLYEHYLRDYSQQSESNKGGARLFQDWQALGRIWTHPRVLKMSSDKDNWLREKKALEESDSEGSLRDFVVHDDSEAESSASESSFASDKSVEVDKKVKANTRSRVTTRSTRSNPKNAALLESSEDEKEKNEGEEVVEAGPNNGEWWREYIEPEHLDDMNQSGKLIMLFGILKEAEMLEDKVLVFSQSLFSLDLIEYFLDKIDSATQDGQVLENLGYHQGNWSKGLDYFRLDGTTTSENRNICCTAFNRENNRRARLFLISTRAGGLGINLTAANRVIIFDASWNPSHDVQSIFRIYRFGQKKPCYVYRFIAHGTMEEKVYDRQVAKQSMSNRVVDEQQVHRHFSSNDLNELYNFTPPTKQEDRPIPALPKDVLFAEILKQFSAWIEKYHEHDSLLENVIEEGLNEEERKLAWEDYENDKKRGFTPVTTNLGMNFNPLSFQIEYLRKQLKAQYPNKPEQELNQILTYQVSLIMRQQQQLANQMQQLQMRPSMSNINMGLPQMMNPFGQQMQQRPPQQNMLAADFQNQYQQLARMQMQQQIQQQQSVLRNHLVSAPGASQTDALRMMMQNYQASRPNDATAATSKPPS